MRQEAAIIKVLPAEAVHQEVVAIEEVPVVPEALAEVLEALAVQDHRHLQEGDRLVGEAVVEEEIKACIYPNLIKIQKNEKKINFHNGIGMCCIKCTKH